MSNLYREPSIDASYQVSVHLAKQFVNGSGQMSNLYKGPSIDAPYQVSVHLAEGFQRRRLK
jgi:hypothetical protein